VSSLAIRKAVVLSRTKFAVQGHCKGEGGGGGGRGPAGLEVRWYDAEEIGWVWGGDVSCW